MKTTLGLVLVLLASPWAAQGDVLKVAPSEAVVLPADESGATRVAVQFDLSGMLEGEGRIIDAAMLEWTPSGVPSEEFVEFTAYAATESWTGASAAVTAPTVSEMAAAGWDIDPTDYARNGGFVRFNVRAVVAGWDSSPASNHGLVLVMGALDDEALVSELGQIRLVVHYGFSR